MPPEVYRVGDLRVDVSGAAVTRDGERIVVPPLTFDLLVALVRRHPGTVRRQDLLQTVWPGEHVTDQALSHRVMVLRKALGDHAEEPHYVAGERGFGYRLVAPVARVSPEDGVPSGEAATGAAAAAARSPDRRRTALLLTVVLLLAGGLVASGRLRQPVVLPPATLSVSVRPFVGSPGMSATEPLSDELGHAIGSALRRVPGVRVAPWDETGVAPQLWLEGHWAGRGEAVELHLQLVDGARRQPVWSRTFRGSLYEVLGREAEMEATVRAAVQQRVAPGAPPASVAIPSHVRRLCWRGELFWLSFTEDGLRRSAEAWETAATLAPDVAAAHAGWALTEATRGLLGQRAPAEAEARARAEARRALELDPELPAARLAESLVRLLFDWDVAGATAEARTALEADPDDARAPVVLALALQAQGRSEESLRLLVDASENDPHSAATLFLTGRLHEMDGRWKEGAAAYARALALEPGLAAARRGTAECLAAARLDTEALVALGDGDARGGAGPAGTLHAAWGRLCRFGPLAGDTIRACLLGGDTERAARVLAVAVEGRWPSVIFVPREALLRPLHDRPAYRAILDRLPPGEGSWTKSR